MKTTKFRPSEVGPIPEEWEVKPFSECFTLMRNNTYSRDCLTDLPGTVANVHYGDVLIRYGAVLDFEKDSVPYLKSGVKPNKDLLKDGDLIFADTAEDETAGKAVEVQGVRPRMAVAGLHTVACRPQGEIFAPRYLGYYINSAAYHNQLLPLMTGTKVTSVSRAGFASTYVAIPPKSEQEKIAEALSDVDALLAAMTKLIEKKRAIKQGAMQQLLTGKKRLAGFTGKWVEKRLGDVADFMTATTPTASIDLRWYIGTENMLADKAGVTQNFASVPYKVVREYIKGDVLTSNIRPYLKKIWLADCNGGCSTDVLVLRTHDRAVCIPEFLVMLVSDDAFFDFAMANAVGTKMPRGDKKVLVNFEVRLPSVPEQKAIASVLSDMDAEIAALEAKRAKYESIKQGMMQELLTGKTRW